MAKEKSNQTKLKHLRRQLKGQFFCEDGKMVLEKQELSRPSRKYPNLTILTMRGKLEQRILTLQNTK